MRGGNLQASIGVGGRSQEGVGEGGTICTVAESQAIPVATVCAFKTRAVGTNRISYTIGNVIIGVSETMAISIV